MNQPYSSNQKSPASLNGQGSISHAPGKIYEDDIDFADDDFTGDIGEITAFQVTPDEAKKITSERLAKSGLKDQALDPHTQQFMQLDIKGTSRQPSGMNQVVSIAPDPDDLPFINQAKTRSANANQMANVNPGLPMQGQSASQANTMGNMQNQNPNMFMQGQGMNPNGQLGAMGNPRQGMMNQVPPMQQANMAPQAPKGIPNPALPSGPVSPSPVNHMGAGAMGAGNMNAGGMGANGMAGNMGLPPSAQNKMANGFNQGQMNVPSMNQMASPLPHSVTKAQVQPHMPSAASRGLPDPRFAPASPVMDHNGSSMAAKGAMMGVAGAAAMAAPSAFAQANPIPSNMANSFGNDMNQFGNMPSPAPTRSEHHHAHAQDGSAFYKSQILPEGVNPTFISPNNSEETRPTKSLAPNKRDLDNMQFSKEEIERLTQEIWGKKEEPAPAPKRFNQAPNQFQSMPNQTMPQQGMTPNQPMDMQPNFHQANYADEPEVDIRAHALAALAMGSGANAANANPMVANQPMGGANGANTYMNGTVPQQFMGQPNAMNQANGMNQAMPNASEGEAAKSATFMPDEYAIKNPNAPSTLINGKFFDFNQNQEKVRTGLEDAARTEAQNTAEQRAKEQAQVNYDPSNIVTAAGPAGVNPGILNEPSNSAGINNFLGAHKDTFATMQNLSRIASGEMTEPAEISTGSTNVIKTLPSKRELSPEESAAAFASALIAKSNRGSDSTRIQGVTHNAVEALPTVNTMIFGPGSNDGQKSANDSTNKSDGSLQVDMMGSHDKHNPLDDRHTTTILSNNRGRLISDDLGHLSSVGEKKTAIPTTPSTSFSFDKIEKEREERLARGEKLDENTLSIVDFTKDDADKDARSSDESKDSDKKSKNSPKKSSEDVMFTMFSPANDEHDSEIEEKGKKASLPLEDDLPPMGKPSFFTEDEAKKGPFFLDVNLKDPQTPSKDKLDNMFEGIDLNDLPDLPELEDTKRFSSLQDLHELNKELREFESWGINLDEMSDKDKEPRLSKEDMRLLEDGLHDKDAKVLEEARAKLIAYQEMQAQLEKIKKKQKEEDDKSSDDLNALANTQGEAGMVNAQNPNGENQGSNPNALASAQNQANNDAFSRLMAQADMQGFMGNMPNAQMGANAMGVNGMPNMAAMGQANPAMVNPAMANPALANQANMPLMGNMNQGLGNDALNPTNVARDIRQPNPLAIQAVAPIAAGVLSNYLLRCKTEVRNSSYFMQKGLTPEIIERFALGYDAHYRVDNSNSMFPMSGNLTLWQAAIVPLNEQSYVAYNMNPMAGPDDRVRRVGQETCFNLRAIYTALPDIDQSTLESLTWPPMCEANDTPIFITSDEMDALSLESLNYRAVALGTPNNVAQLIDFVKQSGISGINFYLCLENSPQWRDCRKALKDALTNLDELCHDVDLSAPFANINEALTNNRGLLLNKLMHLYEISDINLQETIAPTANSALVLSLENLARLQLCPMMYTMSSPAVAVTRLVIASLIENKQSSILYAGSKMQWQMICSLLSFATPNANGDQFGSGSHMQLNGYQAKFLELPLDNDIESLNATLNHGLMAARLNGMNTPTLMLDTSGFDNGLCSMLSPRLAQIAVNMNIPVMIWCSYEQRSIFEGNSVQCIEMKQGGANEIIFNTLDQSCCAHSFSTLQ